jgi:uncharacterized phage-associated protein
MYSDKFKNLVLYILGNSHYREEGIKKLNKLLYFIDFYFYREHERFISDNIQYAKAQMGPIVDHYREIFPAMVKDNVLEQINSASPIIYKAKQPVDLSVFTSEEIDHVCKVLEKYGRLSSSDLENISHEQQPWVLTENNGDIIDPDLALLIADNSDNEVDIENEELRKELTNLANAA